MNSVRSYLLALVLFTFGLCWAGSTIRAADDAPLSAAEQADEKAMAAYADAANFQTGGAIPLAIDGWKAFLKQYSKHAMAPQASHYLGVCYMQQSEPDYDEAAQAFLVALRDKSYDLREESLANCGWCLFAGAGQPPNQNKAKLKQSIQTFAELRKTAPNGDFIDRVWFYTGEAHYGLGEIEKAVAAYNKMLASPQAKQSPLRCDALYARGVAFEDLEQFQQANASFQQLLSACADDDLITDVHLRMGDLAILRGQFDEAIKSFQTAIDSTKDAEDQAYAVFRQAFAHTKADRPTKATELYELLLSKYRDSAYAASATLASAQSSYRSGDLQLAAKRFQKVLQQKNPAAATEAAHWLARIELAKPDPAAAAAIAEKQLADGAEGEFLTNLKLDYAEALSANPNTVEKAFEQFKSIHKQNPDDPLAPRSLYNAAFFALRLSKPDEAIGLAEDFAKRHSGDTLSADVAAIAAEASLAKGDPVTASTKFKDLLKMKSASNSPQRPLWVIRGGASLISAGKADDAIKLLQREASRLPESAQQAEAQLLVGQAHLQASRPEQAAEAFASSLKTNNSWTRANEVSLLRGTALLSAGKTKDAESVWQTLSKSNDRMADQAMFKLGQMSLANGDTKTAVTRFDQIIRSKLDPALVPYATLAKSRALVQQESFGEAANAMGAWLNATPQHPLRVEALMTRGVALRGLKKYDEAEASFGDALALSPAGGMLASVLYESALNDQANEQPKAAIAKLQKIKEDVPDYVGMTKVDNELAWALRDSGDQSAAMKQFKSVIESSPDSVVAAEAAYALAQEYYQASEWEPAAKYYSIAVDKASGDDALSEKSLYRLGWAYFKFGKLDKSRDAFQTQREQHPRGRFSMDAMMMIGESDFKAKRYEQSLASYSKGRDLIRQSNESSKTLADAAERQIRELILLHGGQSAAQLKKWNEALQWYNELRQRFPATAYLSQAFYETGFSYQQMGNSAEALKFYGQVAQKYRTPIGARSRFMMGEIHFADRSYDQAISEFQRVMYGYGAEKAPDSIKNWQSKSGYEAGRCSEVLINQARTPAAKSKAKEFAIKFYRFVIEGHPNSDMVSKAQERLNALK